MLDFGFFKTFKIVLCLYSLLSLMKCEIFEFDNYKVDPYVFSKDIIYLPMLSPSEISYDISAVSLKKYHDAFIFIGLREKLMKNGRFSPKINFCKDEENIFERDFLKLKIPFEQKKFVELKGSFKVTQKGFYTMFFAPCGKEFIVNGRISFRHPDGYLSAHKKNYLFHYRFLIFLYVSLCCYWAWILYKNRSNLFNHHQLITFALASTFFEIIFNHSEIVYINKNGVKNGYLYFAARTLAVFRKTLIRIMVSLVAFGYGILNFGRFAKDKTLALLCFSYISLNFFLEMYHFVNWHSHYESYDVWFFIFKLFIVLSNLSFFKFIFMGLLSSLEELKCHDAYYLKLYRALTAVLALKFCSSALFTFKSVLYRLSILKRSTSWETHWWYDEGFSIIQFTVALIAVMLIWKPSNDVIYKQIPDIRNLPGSNSWKPLNPSESEESSYSDATEPAIVTDPEEVIRQKKNEEERRNALSKQA